MPEKVPLYDDFSQSYDVMVSWDERLNREEPFFRRLFEINEARRVLDVGCATGGHVLRFAEMGLEVVGADPSPEMIRLAEERAAGRTDARFVRAGFGELRSRVEGTFDAVTCLGNTLPHTLTREGLDDALHDIAVVLDKGRVLAIQQLNYDRILKEKRRFLGASSGMRDGVEYLFFRFYDFDDVQLTFNVVTFKKQDGKWSFDTGSTPLRAITQAELKQALLDANFGDIQWLGSYDGESFDPRSSGDLVVIARKT